MYCRVSVLYLLNCITETFRVTRGHK